MYLSFHFPSVVPCRIDKVDNSAGSLFFIAITSSSGLAEIRCLFCITFSRTNSVFFVYHS